MKYYRKSTKPDTDIVADISKAYNLLSKNEKGLYHVTLTKIPAKHAKDLNHKLTNKLFNTIHKDYRHILEFVNYLFIIEYGGIISKGESDQIDNMGLHAHIILHTSLSPQQVEFYLNTCFEKIGNSRIDNISKESNKEGLLSYLLKQIKLLTAENYNFKILA